jgi:uncharacterized protein HemX
MSKTTNNHLTEDEIERLDDRYLTKTMAISSMATLAALVIGFVVYTFTTMANLNTENQLLKQEMQQLKSNMSEYNSNLEILNRNLTGTNLNLKEVETLLKNLDKK